MKQKPDFKPDTYVGFRHEVIPPDEPDCKYLERWLLGVGLPGKNTWFTLRLHHFFRSDEDHLHDHPFWFITLVVKGSYEDWVECPGCKGKRGHRYEKYVDMPSGPVAATGWRNCIFCGGTGQVVGTRMTPGTIRYRPALHRHRVVTDGCWTLVLSGPKIRDWGFWVNGEWMRQRKYFRKFGGSAACE